MIAIHLHGILGDTFGKTEIVLHTNSMQEVMQNLISRFGTSFRDLIEVGQWHLIKGKKKGEEVEESDRFLKEEELTLPLLEEVHFFPAICGAGGKGVGQIILGVVLIVIAIVVAIVNPVAGGALATLASGGLATSIAVAGVLAVAGGVVAMLTKTPTMGDYSSAASSAAEARPSFIFNGVVNSNEQGGPIPLVLGRHTTGSTVVYAGMDTIQL